MEAIRHISTTATDIYTYDHPFNRSEILLLTSKEKILLDQLLEQITDESYSDARITRIWNIFTSLSVCNTDEKAYCNDSVPALKLCSRLSIIGELRDFLRDMDEFSDEYYIHDFITLLKDDLLKRVIDKSKSHNFI